MTPARTLDTTSPRVRAGRAGVARPYRAASLDALSARVGGRVLTPGAPGYAFHSGLFNDRYAGKRPAAVLVAAGVDDLREAILWSRESGVPVVARSTGHSFAGYSVNDGLVVDLSRLSRVSVDGSTGRVTVGGGARAGQLLEALRPHEMAISVGTNPAVGVAGLALGGGADFASRALGLTLDALVETQVVTADGRVLTCREDENADLFWACRGAGGGNFGIHASFTFQAQPVPDVSVCTITWPWPDATNALDAMQRVVRDAPDAFSARLGVSTAGHDRAAAHHGLTATTVAQLLGPASAMRDILDPALTAARPLTLELEDRTFWEARSRAGSAGTGGHFAVRSNYAKTLVAGDGLQAMVSAVERWPCSGNPGGGGVGMFAWGGQINRVDPGETAFVHRDTQFLVSMDTSWSGEDACGTAEGHVAWLDGLHAALADHLSGASYQNFIDPHLEGWQHAYYGANYPRLLAVKSKYDPDDVFSFDQSIGSERA